MTPCSQRKWVDMRTYGPQQTTNGGITLVCACDTDDPCHIHQTEDGIRFIGSLDGPLVLGGAR